ncbi:hypothetical protein Dvina_39840 [Dactylosporangium vinaceum]|uniref:Uncharacterized protein n=1 Tax=Dactylosporangium vinaceum TaxID=53362 RepID=A0ABV5M886_9ACTN|nr:hypothetical protein [Dactylosporangium vinaceum]UAB94259.1 hypothetical protein Dvina_39840 [Dactylosporangium vinaceum]
MSEGLLHNLFEGDPGVVALVYLVIGLAVFAAAFLPGNAPLYRAVSLIVGGVIAVAAAKFMMFGGTVYVSVFAFLAPLALLLIGVLGTVRHVVTGHRRRSAYAGYRPHPAAREYGGPGGFRPYPPTSYAAMHHGYPAPAGSPFSQYAAPDPWADGRSGAHAAQPTGHIPRQPGPRQVEFADPSAGRARHRAP